MKMRKLFTLITVVALLLAPIYPELLRAQTSADASGPLLLSEGDLEQLVAPIALYPDPLIAIILPAATVPTDVVLADRYVQNGGDPNAIDAQNWDDSVKALARYPDTLKMMDDNLDWTNQLGAAVLAQQADVMTAIQAQRAKAQALGNLESTQQQQVVTDQQIIQILPADPQVIYVPVYDPQVVYVERPPAVPFISFGIGFAVGAWLSGDCDWHNHGIYRGGYYRPGYGWARPNVTIINNNNYIWRPNPNKPKPRPPYRPGKPGGGNGSGQLPGWHRPPGGNKPPPGRPGGPGAITPKPQPSKPQPPGGNRPGGPGNRPGVPGNKPGGGKPEIMPVPGTGPGQTKPAPQKPRPGTTQPAKPTTPSTRPGFDQTHPNTKRPTQPAHPQVQPRPQPTTPKPAAPKPQVRPAPKPTAPAHGSFDQQRPSTKRSAPPPPAPAKSAPRAPAPKAPDRAR